MRTAFVEEWCRIDIVGSQNQNATNGNYWVHLWYSLCMLHGPVPESSRLSSPIISERRHRRDAVRRLMDRQRPAVPLATGPAADSTTSPDAPVRWGAQPLAALVVHIRERFHRPLEVELPRLRRLARKARRDAGDADIPWFERLQLVIELFADGLSQHMAREERLFPWLGRDPTRVSPSSVRLLELDHARTRELASELRQLTDDFTLPHHATETQRALWRGLEALDRDLADHHHLEDAILFPRALRGD